MPKEKKELQTTEIEMTEKVQMVLRLLFEKITREVELDEEARIIIQGNKIIVEKYVQV